MTTVLMVCGECSEGGHYVAPCGSLVGTCDRCGHTVDLIHDVKPFLDEGERVVVEPHRATAGLYVWAVESGRES
jgi:hypothetical protein